MVKQPVLARQFPNMPRDDVSFVMVMPAIAHKNTYFITNALIRAIFSVTTAA